MPGNRTLGTRKRANRLSDMTFDEVSVVTRPANQHSRIILWKASDGPPAETTTVAISDANRQVLAKKFAGRLNVDSLPENVAAAVDQLVEDNRRLAKAVTAETKRKRRLLTEDDVWDWDDILDHLDEFEDGAEVMDDVGRHLLSQRLPTGVGQESIVPSERAIAKVESFGPEATFLEASVLDEVEKRAGRMQTKESNLTREEAIAKVLEANPDFYQVYRAAQIAKAKQAALPTGPTVATANRARDDRMQYVQDTIDDKESAMELLRAEAEQMVRDGLAPTAEQALLMLVKENPELMQAWRTEFREPM
jgi:hypothetical protein